MTAHKTLLSILLFLVCISSSADAQLKLSEPKAEDEGAAIETNEPDLPTSSRLRKRKDPGASSPRNTKALNLETDDASATPSNDSIEAAEESVTPPAASASRTTTNPAPANIGAKRTAIPAWSLITQDPEPSMFFSSAVPRTEAIAEDATLNDVCHVGASCWAVGERGVVCRSMITVRPGPRP